MSEPKEEPKAPEATFTQADMDAHVAGLKSALDKERLAAKGAKQWEGLGLTVDEIKDLKATQDKAKEDEAKKRGDFAAIRKQDLDAYAEKETAWKADLKAMQASERSAIVNSSFMSELAKAKFTDTGMDFIPKVYGHRIQIETDNGTRVTRIMQDDGVTPLSGEGDGGHATFNDLVKELAIKHPDLVMSSANGGGGRSPNAAGSGNKKQISRKDFDAAGPFEKSQFVSDGIKIVD